jgi:N-acetylglucosaminyldiphosphoundecaprenol N-acetyl-beta-D-mannosaminyltransferase
MYRAETARASGGGHANMNHALPTISLLGMPIARVSEDGLLDHMFGELRSGRGGWLVTANLDHLRRYARDPELRALYAGADVIVADGMPLVWASQVLGQRLPERVAGSALTHRFADRAAREGRSLYLLGGAEGAGEAAARVLCERHPGLRILGWSAPMVADPPTAADLARVRAELSGLQPDLLLFGLGSPKQERLIGALRSDFPKAWMVGVGISFSFVAGHVARAPAWAQASGLEWVHRLSQEPRRLARRYLIDDIPFALELFARATASRFARKS